MIRSLCVFCGSSPGRRPEYAAAARQLGELLAARGIRLIYGGGNVGLMGELADAVIEHGGEAVGVIPGHLMEKELGHRGISELRVVGSMHERKAQMSELADAFVALPGGIGTLEELLEILTWAQLGLHAKPCGLLDVAGYYEPLVAMIERAADEGFLQREHQRLLIAASEPLDLLDRLARFVPPSLPKWIDKSAT